MTNSKEQAYAAEILSSMLVDSYNSKQVPKMIADFAEAGFTRENLIKSKEKLYLMIITAAYDRRPFSGYFDGYEYLWGMKEKEKSLPARFEKNRISDHEYISKLPQINISKILENEYVKNTPLSSINQVNFSRTLKDAAELTDEIHAKLLSAEIPSDVVNIHNKITEIHGIGNTIASKLIKYTLREIGIGKINPRNIPLTVVWPLSDEYHVDIAIGKINSISHNIVPLAMGLLTKHGDPFAVDALFYLNRYDPKSLDEYISDIKQWSMADHSIQSIYSNNLKKSDENKRNIEKAKRLLSVIKDVCDDIQDITKEQLQGLAQPSKLKSAADKLYATMANYAGKGEIHEMARYYENCLKSASEWDWILERIGKKCLKTEWPRFKQILNDMD